MLRKRETLMKIEFEYKRSPNRTVYGTDLEYGEVCFIGDYDDLYMRVNGGSFINLHNGCITKHQPSSTVVRRVKAKMIVEV